MSRVVETSKFWLVFIIDRINPGTGRIGYAKAFNIDMAVDKILKIILDTVREKKKRFFKVSLSCRLSGCARFSAAVSVVSK